MADAVPTIPRCVPGGESLVSANYANKIIIPLNGILQGKVSPIAGVGSFKYSGGQFILDLSALDQRLRTLEGAAFANYDAEIAALQNNVSILQNNVVTLNNRMNNADITANGSCSGNNITINISLNI